MKTDVWTFSAQWTLNGYAQCDVKYFTDHCALKEYSAEHQEAYNFNGSYVSYYYKLEIENEVHND